MKVDLRLIDIGIQVGLLLVLAPLLQGWIKKVKAFWQMRRGAPVYQPYLDLRKLWNKEEVISKHSSWVFRITPAVVMGAILMAGLAVPGPVTNFAIPVADIFWFVGSLALVRIFMTLAGLEGAGTFGGMGSSRELFLGILLEPLLLLSLIVLALMSGMTTLSEIAVGLRGTTLFFTPRFLVLLALGVIAITEMGRIPVDNPETHLELTMIHEGMLLEYSGRSLALLNWAAYIKQVLFIQLVVLVIWPPGAMGTWKEVLVLSGLYFLKMGIIGALFATMESITVKMRLFRLPNFIAGGMASAVLALITLWIGGNLK